MQFLNTLQSANSKIWIHQANRFFTNLETQSLDKEINTFLSTWTAHHQQLQAQCLLPYQCFVVILLNEETTQASGCSIDALTHFLKQIEQKYEIQLFNRELFAFKNPNTLDITIATKKQMEAFIKEGTINDNTLVFNNLVNTYQQFKTAWEVPFKNSWHKRFFAYRNF